MTQLRITDAQGHEQHLQLNGTEFVMGRDPNIAIPLKDKKVSRRHARLFLQGPDFYVEDLGSANGVVIAGKAINRPYKLAPGTVFEIGSYKLALEAEAEVAAAPFVLAGTSDAIKGQTFLLSPGTVVIGRGEKCDIVILDGSMSRRHAQLAVTPDAVTVEDLGSSNGTFVNDVRVRTKAVKPGDRLRVGNVELQLSAAASGGAPTSSGDRSLRYAAAIAAATVLLLIAAAVVVMMRRGMFGGDDPFATYEQGLQADLATARAHASKEQWDDALLWYQKVLDRDPLHGEASKEILTMDDHRAHLTLLKNARTALDEKRPEVALQQLANLSHRSHYAKQAQEAAEKARAMLADMALEEARVACGRQDWRACHRKAVVVLMNRPDSNPGLALIREAESQLKSRRIKFTPWAPEG